MNTSLKHTILVGVVILAIAACSSEPKKESAQEVRGPKAQLAVELHPLFDSLMALHDHEAMPLYEPVVNLRIRIKNSYDSVATPTEEDQQLMQQLGMAGDAMMEWMRAFETDYEGWTKDSAKSYLEKEYQQMREINAAMREAVLAAETRLGQ